MLVRCYTCYRRIYWEEKLKEIEETFNDRLNGILFMNLEEETMRWKDKVARIRQNITNDTERQQQQETEFKKRISR